MPRTRKIEDQPLERLLELIDEKVAEKLDAEELAAERHQEVARLVTEARNKGATMPELTQHVLKLEKTGKRTPVSRQAVDTMIAVETGRREARTTRASRKRREPEAVGGVNLDALS